MSLDRGSRGLNMSQGSNPIKCALLKETGGFKPDLNFASRIHLVRLGTVSRNGARWPPSAARCEMGMQDSSLGVYIRSR